MMKESLGYIVFRLESGMSLKRRKVNKAAMEVWGKVAVSCGSYVRLAMMGDVMQRLGGRLQMTDTLARRKKFIDQPVVTICTVSMVICKYIAYENLYMKVGSD